jgi:recombination protein RecA
MSIVKQSQLAEPDKINIYVDMEAGAFTAEYAYKMGIDIDPNKFLIIKPDYAEQGFVTIYNLIATGKVGVCVWDSLAGALTKEAKGNTAEDNDSRAGLARLLSNEMRRLAPLLGKTGTTMLMVNQIRTQMTQTLSWNDITGGRAQKFYASVRIDLAKKEKAKDFSGNLDRETIIAHVTKNKVSAPYKEAEFDIKFGEGIIAESNILDMATKEGIVSSSVNGWFSFPNLETGEEIFKVRTKSAATDYLVDNPDYCAALEEKLLGYSRVTEYEAEPTTDEDYDFKETEPKEEIMVAE